MRISSPSVTPLLTLLCFVSLSLSAQDKEAFQNPPTQMRTRTLWYWNAPLSHQEIDRQLTELREKCGYSGVGILPYERYFSPAYLSEEYFTLYEYTARKAKSLGMTLSLYDEAGFPSGSGGAIHGDGIPRFAQRYPELTLQRLDKIDTLIDADHLYRDTIRTGGTLMGIVAMNTVTLQRIDLTALAKKGRIEWHTPAGDSPWRIMQFICTKDGDPNFDYLNPQAIHAFMEMTHEAYYRRFPDLFGTTINETFYDEITLYRAQGRVWTPNFNREYARRHGGDSPVLLYPALWYTIGPTTQSARNALFSLRSDLYAETYGLCADRWSKAHGVQATGHQDNEEIPNPVGTSGDLMKCMKYQEIPGIDKIGGERPAEKFYKIISSAAYNWDHSQVMSETFAAMGNLPMDSMYRIVMDQYTKGINEFITHAVWYNDRATHFPPELSDRNPHYQGKLYDFNTFVGRLSVMLRTADRFYTEIAVLYPIHTMQGDHHFDGPLPPYKGGVEIPYLDYVEVGHLLSDVIGRDFEWLHPDILDSACRITPQGLSLKNTVQDNCFHTLIIPSCRTISVASLSQAAALFEKGGRIIFTGQLPAKSTEPGRDQEIQTLMNRLLVSGERVQMNAAGGKVIHLCNLSSITLSEALVQEHPYDISFSGRALHYIHKERKKRGSLFYIANLDCTDYHGTITLLGKKQLEAWDPHTGKSYPLKTSIHKQERTVVTHLSLSLGALRSLFLVEK